MITKITRFKCSSFKKYKAVRRPTCGCLACFLKYTFKRGKPARKGGIVQYKKQAGNFPLDPTAGAQEIHELQPEENLQSQAR